MRILFLAQHKWPHVGGVERHTQRVAGSLQRLGHSVKIISEKDIKYPHIKFSGLLYIWLWLWRNRKLIKETDIVHCHDVFIWYLPFRFLYLQKPVYTTFHGWEGVWPIPWKNIFLKRLAARLSRGSLAVGKYIEKYYGIETNKILYGGTDTPRRSPSATIRGGGNRIVFVGRLEKDTGILEFLHWFRSLDYGYKVEFVGDGSLRKECEKFGKVHGFTDPMPFLKRAKICIPGGYLSYIEAKQAGCETMTFYDSPLKKDYWDEIQKVKKFPTWDEIADEYISLYNGSK